MDFYAILDQVVALLRQRQRVTFRALKRQFTLDDDALADLTAELLYAHPQVRDDAGQGLLWTGEPAPATAPSVVAPPQQAPLAYTPPYLAEKILTSRGVLEGERKQVTVLFADLKGSTELIRDLDPEEAQQLLDPAIHIMMEAVHRFEGTVNQVLGDGIMSIFGAPIAHEDHAARACYAALAMQAAMHPYGEAVRRSHGMTMRLRVGLNSGEVVVRTIGNDLHMDYSAVGHTTHLASRMEQLAAPGSITLTGTTLRLVEGLVRVNDLGPIPVKGMTEPMAVYELTGISALRRRLQASVARGLTTFVGRDTEIVALNHALDHAGKGHGQIVAAVGDAGVGKSRLIYEFVHSHRTQGWLVLESAAVSYGKATPYFPVVDLLKRYVHVEEGDEPRTICAKVTGHILTLDAILQETIPPVLSLLDALPEDSPFAQLDPPQRRQRTHAALTRILLRASQEQPLLLVFEDLHWMDSETQGWLDSLVESLPTAPLLLVVNYRPEYHHAWGSKTWYTQLRLDPLPSESADAFLAALLGNDSSLDPLTKLLIARTEGNPFFLEESVRTLVETQGLVGEPGAYRLAQALPTIQVPATVQAVLAARMDRLPQDEKHLLQTAAVIGMEVPFRLLQAIAELSDEGLSRGLTSLHMSAFLYETSLFPEPEYTFTHALTHEVAYGSLLQERRRMLHARIVDALEVLAGDHQAEQIERFAHHASLGEVWDKALTYCRQAGEKALSRSAYREAVGYVEQALSALTHLPETRHTCEHAIDLRLVMRTALSASGDNARILAYLHEAEALAATIDDPQRLGHASLFLASQLVFGMGSYEQALAVGARVLARATASGDGVLQALAQQNRGLAYRAQGDYQRALDCFGQTVAFFDSAQRRARLRQFFLPEVSARAWLAWCHADLGTFAAGYVLGDEGLHMAEAAVHPSSLMLAAWGSGLLSLRQGDLDRARPLLERAIGLCQDIDSPATFPLIAAALGTAYTLCGCVADAVPLLTQAIAQPAGRILALYQALPQLALGEAYLRHGNLEEAHGLAERALAHARAHQERGNQAYALQLLGAIATHRTSPDADAATAHYCQALALAEALGQRPLQAHCHRGLGTLSAATGQWEQARTALSTAIEMYRDMEMTFWLPETAVALAQVDA